MKWIIPLAILIFFEGVADIFSKHWSLKGGFRLAAFALISYLIANTFWLFALRNGSGLGRGAIIFSVASAIIAILIGLLFYHEKVSGLQFLGMLLGVFSLVLIFWE